MEPAFTVFGPRVSDGFDPTRPHFISEVPSYVSSASGILSVLLGSTTQCWESTRVFAAMHVRKYEKKVFRYGKCCLGSQNYRVFLSNRLSVLKIS